MSGAGTGPRRQVAVVGSGIAGLTAAYLLHRSCDVTLFEAEQRLGGHAHTHRLTGDDGRAHPVDSGFIVHNVRAYPLLLRLFAELGVATQAADMSMSVSCAGCGLEYAGGRGPRGFAARIAPRHRGSYLRMLAEVHKFHRAARSLASCPDAGGTESRGQVQTLGEFLAAEGFSRYFRSHFARPIVSAVWSCSPLAAFDYPVAYLCAFLANHGFLSAARSFSWRTVVGGSARYVARIAVQIQTVRSATPVRCVRRLAQGVQVRDDAGRCHDFDAAVIATHPDQALALLEEPTPPERAILGAFSYSRNAVVLHTDQRVLPRRSGARASWNYQQDACDPAGPVRMSYDMNRLQRLHAGDNYLVTLNAVGGIPAARIHARMTYEHPVYTPESVAAQQGLPELNDGTLSFAGAYHGWGFHEDGCRAGAAAALSLGGSW